MIEPMFFAFIAIMFTSVMIGHMLGYHAGYAEGINRATALPESDEV